MKLRSPAVARNTAPILEVLREWLPPEGTILEVASGSGEHALAFAEAFASLLWQPSDPDSAALASIESWREEGPANLLPPARLDVVEDAWPIGEAAAVLAINMVHISPWEASIGLLTGAARLLGEGAPLILYGPWRAAGEALEPSNEEFDQSLKERDERWGLRMIEDFAAEARKRGFELIEQRRVPANNRMLLFRRVTAR